MELYETFSKEIVEHKIEEFTDFKIKIMKEQFVPHVYIRNGEYMVYNTITKDVFHYSNIEDAETLINGFKKIIKTIKKGKEDFETKKEIELFLEGLQLKESYTEKRKELEVLINNLNSKDSVKMDYYIRKIRQTLINKLD